MSVAILKGLRRGDVMRKAVERVLVPGIAVAVATVVSFFIIPADFIPMVVAFLCAIWLILAATYD